MSPHDGRDTSDRLDSIPAEFFLENEDVAQCANIWAYDDL